MSLVKRFGKIDLQTPAGTGLLSSVKREAPKFGLTTVVEDLAELDLSSKKKTARRVKESKDDFGVMLRTVERLDVEEAKNRREQMSEKKYKDSTQVVAKQLNELFKAGDDLEDNQILKGKYVRAFAHKCLIRLTKTDWLSIGLQGNTTLAKENQKKLREQLGEHGYQTLQLSIRKETEQRKQYSMSFIAAITQHEVLGSQIIEGAFDSTIFEEFIFQILKHLRQDPKTATKTIVVLMDNAVIHRHD